MVFFRSNFVWQQHLRHRRAQHLFVSLSFIYTSLHLSFSPSPCLLAFLWAPPSDSMLVFVYYVWGGKMDINEVHTGRKHNILLVLSVVWLTFISNPFIHALTEPPLQQRLWLNFNRKITEQLPNDPLHNWLPLMRLCMLKNAICPHLQLHIQCFPCRILLNDKESSS